MKRETFLKQGRGVAMAACALLIGTGMMQSCVDRDDNILTGQPDWLGNSIYERLEEDGNYTYMLRLIDDLDQKEVLGHTGSKTLFPANDASFEEWFRTNEWGIRSYDQLSTARKKLMLNNSMINNAYLIALMSNVAGDPPKEGLAMRRTPAGDPLDSVRIMKVDEMPTAPAWEALRKKGKVAPFVEHDLAPMIHFLTPFMKYYKITDNDLSVLTNHKSNSVNESWINGHKVVEADITCKNGYIHRVDGVVESAPNMAEIIHQHKNMSKWASLIDRFSAPYPVSFGPYPLDRNLNELYRANTGTKDTLYYKAYFNRQSGHKIEVLPDDKQTPVPGLLAFDPAWNGYMYTNTMNYDMHYDAGAMIVPTNAALEAWCQNEGKDLMDEYHELDSIPFNTLSKLINVNMLDDFTGKVPSKFNTVLDDAKEQLGITPADIDSCFMGCNGIVYLVNKVFTPSEYASVAYPALAHASTMDVFYWAVNIGFTDDNKKLSKGTFLPYLLSMDAEYAFLMPTNKAMQSYIDPSTYGVETGGNDTPDLIQFTLDPTKTERDQMQGSRYNCVVAADGSITVGTRKQANIAQQPVFTMLDDMLDQMIIVLPVKGVKLETYLAQGYRYFKTKGGSLIYAEPGTNGYPVFAGGWQLEHNKRLAATTSFVKKNGTSYELDEQMPLGAQKSLYMTLKEHNEYAAFLKLLSCDYSNLLQDKLNSYSAGLSKQNNKNFRLFDNYNYTVFVPTNESIEKLQDDGVLPTWRELTLKDAVDDDIIDSIIVAEHWKADKSQITEKFRTDSVVPAIRSVITDFVRYHVQDRSVAIGMAPEPNMTGNVFESMLRNPSSGRFYQLTTTYDTNNMTIRDVAGNTRHVQKTSGLYNNMVREYYFQGTGNTARLYMGSDAMVHLIDKPLFVSNTHKRWQDVAKAYLDNMMKK